MGGSFDWTSRLCSHTLGITRTLLLTRIINLDTEVNRLVGAYQEAGVSPQLLGLVSYVTIPKM